MVIAPSGTINAQPEQWAKVKARAQATTQISRESWAFFTTHRLSEL